MLLQVTSLFRYISICGFNHLTQYILEKSIRQSASLGAVKTSPTSSLRTVSVGKAALELASDRKAGGTGLAARAEARAATQVVDAKANVAKCMASKTMTQYDAAYFATAAAASNPPRLEDLLNTPSKEILAQECELQDLPVKRSGDDTAYPRQATELVQFLLCSALARFPRRKQ